MMCDVVQVLRNWYSKPIAMIGVMVLGIQTFNGKLRWEVSLIIIVGIMVLFSAEKIVGGIGGTK